MLSIKDKGRLIQIIKHCKRIKSKIKNVDRHSFDKDEDIREIVCFNIFQIGELAKGLSIEFTDEYSQIPWKQIKGMRDIIGHGYETINNDIVYNTCKKDIDDLLKNCVAIINNN